MSSMRQPPAPPARGEEVQITLQPWSKPTIEDVSVSEHTEIASLAGSDSSHTANTLS